MELLHRHQTKKGTKMKMKRQNKLYMLRKIIKTSNERINKEHEDLFL